MHTTENYSLGVGKTIRQIINIPGRWYETVVQCGHKTALRNRLESMHKVWGTYAAILLPFLLTVTFTPLTCKRSEEWIINNSFYIYCLFYFSSTLSVSAKLRFDSVNISFYLNPLV
mgnify:CR=1 FL=1